MTKFDNWPRTDLMREWTRYQMAGYRQLLRFVANRNLKSEMVK